MERHISQMFRDEYLADAYVSVVAASAEGAREEVDSFPAHLLVLTRSPYFRSQVYFARHQEEQRSRNSRPASPSADAAVASNPCTRSRSRSSTRQDQVEQPDPLQLQRTTHSSSCTGAKRPTLVLTVSDQAHAPAAVAMIAALYGVGSALNTLQQQELLYVIQYADMIQVKSIATAAVALLKAAATAGQGLTATCMAALAALPAWPSCLLSLIPVLAEQATAVDTAATAADAEAAKEGASALMSKNTSIQQVFTAALGNLEAVWQHKDLINMLLELPLAAMQLLLLSDQLQVYSEDTVLLTVIRYIDQQALGRDAQAKQQLSELVRVPHLSDLQLAAHCCPDSGSCLVPYRRQLWHLQQLRRLKATEEDLRSYFSEIEGEVPSSWLKDARRILAPPADGHSVSLTCRMPIKRLQAWVEKCSKQRQSLEMRLCACTDSKMHRTPPLHGG